MTQPVPTRKPEDDELDVYGLTHQGLVRKNNEDQFLMMTIHKRVNVVSTSLTDKQRLPLGDERLAWVSMVADGVGGLASGEEASATALEVAMQYVTHSMNCYYRADSGEKRFIEELQAAAMEAHTAVVAKKSGEGRKGRMATTLTLWMGVWPYFYLLQVGDSRYYMWRQGTLTQVSRDQTIAQDLVDQGVLTRTAARRSQFANVLSSALGGDEAAPVVTRLQSEWYQVHLLCSDGLTKHVSDEKISERLAAMTGAKQVAEQLLQDALDGGGTDNITVIVGRAVPKEGR
jgi:serine/threonine protein phosphatase PrpC